MDDLLTYYGGGIKLTDPGDGDAPLRMEGPLVVFSGPDDTDLEGDFFTKDTDFGPLSDDGTAKVAAYYHHGLDPTFGLDRIGSAKLTLTEEGVWAEYQITRRKGYLRQLLDAAKAHGLAPLGQSSGALMHTYARDAVRTASGGEAGWIKSWTIGEASPTPTPAEPRTAVVPLKSLRAPAPDPLALRLKSLADGAEARSAFLRALRAL